MQEIIFSKNNGLLEKINRRASKMLLAMKQGVFFKKIKNYYAVKMSLMLKMPKVWGRPFYLMIEPTNICNLKCPLCPTGEGKLGRKNELLDVSSFRQAIDEMGDYLLEVNITNYGEPFIHKDLCEMIEYIKRKGIKVCVGSNGHYFTDKDSVKKFILSGVDDIYISLDGTDQENYAQYRKNGDFDKVVKGIKLLVDTRNKLKKKTPFIELQFLVMSHNESRMQKIREIAKDIGVDRLILKPVSFNVSEWGHQDVREQFKKLMPEDESFRLYKISEKDFQWKQPIGNKCDYLWRGMVILCDGVIVPCCIDPRADLKMGEIKDGIMKVWNSPKYIALRKQILKDKKQLALCGNCQGM